jgi:hypothetical protein
MEATLPMENFVDIPRPGVYTVTILFHDNVEIADLADPKDLAQLIIFRSKPLQLRVQP